jgi:transposase
MEYQKLLQIRKQKGFEIANKKKITEQNGSWIVPSQSNPSKTYKVTLRLDKSTCTCQDFVGRGIRCKHIFAVEITLTKTIDSQGNTTITKTERITYKQDWVNYTKAQNEEGRLFKVLLKDLVKNVAEEPYTFGRPKIPLSIEIFCAIDKVYSMQSSRRAHSRYKDAESKEQITKAPNYNAINKTLNNAEMTHILKELLHITAMPLKSIETKFSPDSTGFRTTQFNEYCKEKHNIKKEHKWVKCHAITGNTTNIITDAIITTENGADSPQFIPLVQETASMGFDMQEVSADKAYNSIANYNAVQEVGGTAYIPYKSNITAMSNTGNKARLWRKMFYYFKLNQEDFLMHYHSRSNVETTFFSVKTKFGDCLKNKTFTSQTNEVLCKLIAYNITVLISAMFELKMDFKLIQHSI